MSAWTEARGKHFRLRYTTPEQAPLAGTIQALVGDAVASRIAATDPTLWGPDAEAEAARRLDWVSLPTASRDLLPALPRRKQEAPGGGNT